MTTMNYRDGDTLHTEDHNIGEVWLTHTGITIDTADRTIKFRAGYTMEGGNFHGLMWTLETSDDHAPKPFPSKMVVHCEDGDTETDGIETLSLVERGVNMRTTDNVMMAYEAEQKPHLVWTQTEPLDMASPAAT